MNHENAQQQLTGRCKDRRKLANNTYLERRDGGNFAIKLHETDVVTINSDGTYTLNSGGWQTVTTKQRINEYTRAGISQKAGVWYMSDGSLFYDGIVINSDGTPVTPKSGKQTTEYETKLKAIKKRARQYAKDYVKALQDGNVAMPSNGDCWYCALRTEDGKPLGEQTSNTAHILDHMDEKYYVPSLLVNAGRSAGYRDDQIGLMGIGGHRVFIDPENNIYKYIVKQLQRGL